MYKIRDGYLLRSVVDEWVVIGAADSARPNQFMLLNDTGARLWKLLERGADEDALTGALTGEYAVDEVTARADAQAFVGRLLEGGIAEACV